MHAEQITIVDNRQAYRRKLLQLLAANPRNIPLIKLVMRAKLAGIRK